MSDSTVVTISVATAAVCVSAMVGIGIAWGGLRQKVSHIEVMVKLLQDMLQKFVDASKTDSTVAMERLKIEAKEALREAEKRIADAQREIEQRSQKDLRDTEARLLKDLNGVGRKLESALRDGLLGRRAGSSSQPVEE